MQRSQIKLSHVKNSTKKQQQLKHFTDAFRHLDVAKVERCSSSLIRLLPIIIWAPPTPPSMVIESLPIPTSRGAPPLLLETNCQNLCSEKFILSGPFFFDFYKTHLIPQSRTFLFLIASWMFNIMRARKDLFILEPLNIDLGLYSGISGRELFLSSFKSCWFG